VTESHLRETMPVNELASPLQWFPPPASQAALVEQTLRDALTQGLPLAFPTETYYALGGNALSADLTAQVYRLKSRPPDKALPLLIHGPTMLDDLAAEISPEAQRLMERFWPGPLTLVLPARRGLPPHLAGPEGTLALRWSSSPVVEYLLAVGKVPLVGTSANLSGEPPALTAEEVIRAFPQGLAMVLAMGMANVFAKGTGQDLTPSQAFPPPSTLVSAVGPSLQLLRPGAIPWEALLAALD